MFASKKAADGIVTKKVGVARDHGAVMILTSGCHFSGKLFCRGSSRIAGKIEGQIISEGLLIIEPEAIITADVKAEDVVIQGVLQGKLVASGRVELAVSAQVDGDITTPNLMIREGAQFNGRAVMTKPVAATVGHGNLKVASGTKAASADSALKASPAIEIESRFNLSAQETPVIHVPSR